MKKRESLSARLIRWAYNTCDNAGCSLGWHVWEMVRPKHNLSRVVRTCCNCLVTEELMRDGKTWRRIK